MVGFFPVTTLKFHFFCPVFGLYILLGLCPPYSVVLEHIRSTIRRLRITFVDLCSELRRHSTIRRSATYVVLEAGSWGLETGPSTNQTSQGQDERDQNNFNN